MWHWAHGNGQCTLREADRETRGDHFDNNKLFILLLRDRCTGEWRGLGFDMASAPSDWPD